MQLQVLGGHELEEQSNLALVFRQSTSDFEYELTSMTLTFKHTSKQYYDTKQRGFCLGKPWVTTHFVFTPRISPVHDRRHE